LSRIDFNAPVVIDEDTRLNVLTGLIESGHVIFPPVGVMILRPEEQVGGRERGVRERGCSRVNTILSN
jgi:hypothetical protein